MIDEDCILSAGLYDRAAYDQLASHVEPGDLSAAGELIWAEVKGYYAADPKAKQADPGLLATRIARQHPKAEDTVREVLHRLKPELGGKNPAREVLELKRRSAGEALMVAISQQVEPAKVLPLLEAYSTITAASSVMASGTGGLLEADLAELITRTEAEGARTMLLPKSLNRYMRGGILPGHCIVVFGRVNVGKSTFAIHNAAGFLRQGKRVLYIENRSEQTS